MERAFDILRHTFGHENFRLQQEQVVRTLVEDGENALVLFPTGGGKSLAYQIPALCLDGLTLVISPLLALIKDQVDSLQRKGIKACNLDSTLDASQAAAVKHDVLNGTMKLLYVAPERLNNEGFVELIRHTKLSLLAVDESHCISQWGASFRPEYLKIARFAEEMDVGRVLCLTATATPSVVEDICSSFFIKKERVFKTSMYRSNLSLEVRIAQDQIDKVNQLLPILQSRSGPSIVYVTLQRHAEEIAAMLTSRDPNISPWVYHAGLDSSQRQAIQEAFMASDNGVVCATIAFGMGIDKADIRQIVHLYMPKTMENYSQEIGRAGRDGLASQCYMFLCASDIPILEGFCRGDTPSKNSVELWLQGVAFKKPDDDGSLNFNHYEQSRTFDIRSNVLNLLYAFLELDEKLIRAITPMYSIYDITTLNSGALLNDDSYPAKVIRQNWSPKKNGTGYTINVVESAERTPNIGRDELVKKINLWERDGNCTSKGSQVRARYKVLNPLPTTEQEISALACRLHSRMVSREEENIAKLRQVIAFATIEDCFAARIAEYFGDSEAIPTGMCNHCTFCRTASAIEFSAAYDEVPNPISLRAVLNAIPDRDDPLMLTRFAFGVTSPRLTTAKLSTGHPLFGSMCGTEWRALLEVFDEECKREGYRAVAPSKVTATRATKRKAPVSSSSGRGGTHSNAKRGRRY